MIPSSRTILRKGVGLEVDGVGEGEGIRWIVGVCREIVERSGSREGRG